MLSQTSNVSDWFLRMGFVLRIAGAKLGFEDVSKATFPLPTLGSILESASQDVHEGRGFVVVRGLNPSRYSMEENAIIYLGISSYIGGQRARQNMEGMKFSKFTRNSSHK